MIYWKNLFFTILASSLLISNPATARFYGVDPVEPQQHLKKGNTQGFNRYAYANNNPYKYTDPNGEAAILGYFATPPGIATLKSGATALTTGLKALSIGLTGMIVVDHVVDPLMNEEDSRKLGDLETIHDPDHPQNDPEIGKLTDEELKGAIHNPENGDRITVKGNKVYDGNTRINEAKKRGFDPDMEIGVDTLPESTFDDNDPLGPYGELD